MSALATLVLLAWGLACLPELTGWLLAGFLLFVGVAVVASEFGLLGWRGKP